MILILGRFQPLHKGHLKVIQDASMLGGKLVVAIGSAQKGHEKDNPFDAYERERMLKALFEKEEIDAKIIWIDDIPNDDEYVDYVLRCCDGLRPEKVVTENSHTKYLFERAGFEVHITPRFFGISATGIRQAIRENRNWENNCPEVVVNIVKEIGGVERIKRLG